VFFGGKRRTRAAHRRRRRAARRPSAPHSGDRRNFSRGGRWTSRMRGWRVSCWRRLPPAPGLAVGFIQAALAQLDGIRPECLDGITWRSFPTRCKLVLGWAAAVVVLAMPVAGLAAPKVSGAVRVSRAESRRANRAGPRRTQAVRTPARTDRRYAHAGHGAPASVNARPRPITGLCACALLLASAGPSDH
jgi:hypothetical protein